MTTLALQTAWKYVYAALEVPYTALCVEVDSDDPLTKYIRGPPMRSVSLLSHGAPVDPGDMRAFLNARSPTRVNTDIVSILDSAYAYGSLTLHLRSPPLTTDADIETSSAASLTLHAQNLDPTILKYILERIDTDSIAHLHIWYDPVPELQYSYDPPDAYMVDPPEYVYETRLDDVKKMVGEDSSDEEEDDVCEGRYLSRPGESVFYPTVLFGPLCDAGADVEEEGETVSRGVDREIFETVDPNDAEMEYVRCLGDFSGQRMTSLRIDVDAEGTLDLIGGRVPDTLVLCGSSGLLNGYRGARKVLRVRRFSPHATFCGQMLALIATVAPRPEDVLEIVSRVPMTTPMLTALKQVLVRCTPRCLVLGTIERWYHMREILRYLLIVCAKRVHIRYIGARDVYGSSEWGTLRRKRKLMRVTLFT